MADDAVSDASSDSFRDAEAGNSDLKVSESVRNNTLEQKIESGSPAEENMAYANEDGGADVGSGSEENGTAENGTQKNGTTEIEPTAAVNGEKSLEPQASFSHDSSLASLNRDADSRHESFQDSFNGDGFQGAQDDGFDDDDFNEFGNGDDIASDDEFGEFRDPQSASAPDPGPLEPLPHVKMDIPPRTVSSTKFRSELKKQLDPLFERFTAASQAFTTPQKVPTLTSADQLVSRKSARALTVDMSRHTPVAPVDFRRSRVRLEQLKALKVPVDLDDILGVKEMKSLSIASPDPASLGSAGPSHERASALTPVDDTYLKDTKPVDLSRAFELTEMTPEDLSILPLAELEALSKEFDSCLIDASNNLTYYLSQRERESSSADAYNAIISDLVTSAVKRK